MRWGETDADFGSLFSCAAEGIGCCFWIFFREVASGGPDCAGSDGGKREDFNPGVTDSDQLSDLGCTSFFSVVAAAVLDAAEGDVVSSDAAALSYDVAVVLFDGSCAVAVILSDAAPPLLMGLVLWCYLLFSPSLPSSA